MAEERLTIDEEKISRFIRSLREKGRKEETIRCYESIMTYLLEYLADDREIDEVTVMEWYDWMLDQGLAHMTACNRISCLNSFLNFYGKRDWMLTDFSEREPRDNMPELSRAEYVRLLQAAKKMNNKKAYLLVRTLGSVGLRVTELAYLTVDVVDQGTAVVDIEGHARVIHIPEPLRLELLDFIQERGIYKGPVFQGKNGQAMPRRSVWGLVAGLSLDAKVDRRKANPRTLNRMYRKAFRTIEMEATQLAMKSYDRMLETEDEVAGLSHL